MNASRGGNHFGIPIFPFGVICLLTFDHGPFGIFCWAVRSKCFFGTFGFPNHQNSETSVGDFQHLEIIIGIFPNVPQSSLGIHQIPQLLPPLEHPPPLRTLQNQFEMFFSAAFSVETTLAKNQAKLCAVRIRETPQTCPPKHTGLGQTKNTLPRDIQRKSLDAS